MSVTVQVSSQLASITGKDQIVLETKKRPLTVGDAIDEITETHPKLRDRLLTDGAMREWVKVFVDDKEIYEDLAGLDTRIVDGTKMRIEVPGKARVTFVQEDRVAEVEPGRTIKEIALELGIDPNRKYQRLISCDGLGIFDGCKCWVKPSSKRAVSGKSWTERALHDLPGWQRLACQTRVYGDVEVWTLPQGDERLREPRPIAPPPPMPKKRERYLESIFRTPAADDDEGDAETKPAAKKSPTEAKAKRAPGAAPEAVGVTTAVPAPPTTPGPAAAPSEKPAAVAKTESELVEERVERIAEQKGVATPIVSPIEAAPAKGADEPKAVDDAQPSEGAKTAAAEAHEAPTAQQPVKKDVEPT